MHTKTQRTQPSKPHTPSRVCSTKNGGGDKTPAAGPKRGALGIKGARPTLGYDGSSHTTTNSHKGAGKNEIQATYPHRTRSRVQKIAARHGTSASQTGNDGMRHTRHDRGVPSNAPTHLESLAHSEIRSGQPLGSGQTGELPRARCRRNGLVERTVGSLRTATSGCTRKRRGRLVMAGLPVMSRRGSAGGRFLYLLSIQSSLNAINQSCRQYIGPLRNRLWLDPDRFRSLHHGATE